MSVEDIMTTGRENPGFVMPEDEYPGTSGALARLFLTVAADKHLTPQAALQAGLNYCAAQGMTLVSVDQTPAGSMYVFTTGA
jgi:hypothetical protein